MENIEQGEAGGAEQLPPDFASRIFPLTRSTPMDASVPCNSSSEASPFRSTGACERISAPTAPLENSQAMVA